MLESKVFKILSFTLVISVCSSASIPLTTQEQQQRLKPFESEGTNGLPESVVGADRDHRVELCKTNCIQRCLENRKTKKEAAALAEDLSSSHDSHFVPSHEKEENDVVKKKIQPGPVHEQCLAGCQEACSFYKRLLTGKSERMEDETLSDSDDDNKTENGHTKSSFVTGESDLSQETTQKSSTSTSTTTAVPTTTTTTAAADAASSTSTPSVSDYTHGKSDVDSSGKEGGSRDVVNHLESSESGQPQVGSLSEQTKADNELGGAVVEEPFELRVASLIHQKSLVITELKWDDIGGNPNQAYLVTWELTDGGLKGHLVTDSSSVTLSLWPNSLYQIQVQQFEPMEDSEGTQPSSSNHALKSLPLIVDTSEASFPMGKSSPLFSTSSEEEEEEDEDYSAADDSVYHHSSEDEYVEDGNEKEAEEEEDEAHKSKEEGLFHSTTSLLGISLCATVLVLVLLSVASMVWIRLKSWKKVECFPCCFTSGMEPQLLSHEDLSDVLCSSGSGATSPTMEKRGLKFYRMPKTLFGSSKEYKITGLESNSSSVSTISTGATPQPPPSFVVPCSIVHCNLNHALTSETGLVFPTNCNSTTTTTTSACLQQQNLSPNGKL